MKTACRLLAFTVLLCLTVSAPAAAATYGGSATGAQVTVPATGTTIRAATGSIGISGGTAEASLLVGDIPGSATGGVVALSAGVMHSAIVGLDATRAESSTGDITLTVSNNTITADFLMARSTASCGPAVTGSSQLTNLVINGQAITVTGAPNQTVALPNGTAIINEQISSIVGSSAELTVNAFHVTTTDAITGQQLADVMLATVDAKIDCSGGSPPNAQFTTGGGWVPGILAGHATFGFVAGTQDSGFRGHLVYKDSSFPFSLQGTVITAFTAGCDGGFEGTGNSPEQGAVYFIVDIHDGGEPGTSDTLQIKAFHGTTPPAPTDVPFYTDPDTLLRGGNIQAHGFSC